MTAQDRWQVLENGLATELIDVEGYPDMSARLVTHVVTSDVPDWVYEQDILFMCQMNW